MEEEITIDVRQYIDVLLRRWRIIFSVTLITALLAALFALAFPPGYQAVAGVAIVQTKTDIEFDPRFKTTSQDMLGTGYVAAIADARRSALLGLVQNDAIANAVIAELEQQLEPKQRDPATLLNAIKAELLQKGDLIQIKVTNKDPKQAADIANTWAREYELLVNGIYGGAPSSYSLSVNTELDRTKQDYEQAQTDLEKFIADNQINELTRQIGEKQHIINALQTGKQTAITSVIDEEVKSLNQVIKAYLNAQAVNKLLVFEKEQEGWRKLITAYADAQNDGRTTVFDQQVKATLQTLSDYYGTQLRVRQLINDAASMREQVRTGGDAAAASNGLALLLLKAQAFSLSAPLPGQLQVQVDVPNTSSLAQLADLDALIAALEKRDGELSRAITDLSQDILKGDSYTFVSTTMPISNALTLAIVRDYPQLFDLGDLARLGESIADDNALVTASAEKSRELLQLKQMETLPAYSIAAEPLTQAINKLQQEVRDLQAELEQESATQQKLAQARDLAWETYTTLSRKGSEVSIASTVTGSEVRFAAPAVPPNQRASSRTRGVIIAGLLGAFLGVLAAFSIEYLFGQIIPQVQPDRPQPLWGRALGWVLHQGPGLPTQAPPDRSSG